MLIEPMSSQEAAIDKMKQVLIFKLRNCNKFATTWVSLKAVTRRHEAKKVKLLKWESPCYIAKEYIFHNALIAKKMY